jgi:hypothetical protein
LSNGHAILRAFRIDGSAVPGWPSEGIAVAGWFRDATVGPDGTVYVATATTTTVVPSYKDPWPLSITALDPQGNVRAGWPYRSPAGYFPVEEQGKFLVLRPGGGICFRDRLPGASVQESWATEIACLDHSGSPVPGWPVYTDIVYAPPAFDPDGSVYVDRSVLGADGTRTAQLIALDSSGKPRHGWTPVTVPASGNSEIHVQPDGSVIVSMSPLFRPPVLFAFDKGGKRMTAWEGKVRAIIASAGKNLSTMSVDFGPDGTTYLSVAVIPATQADPLVTSNLAIRSDGTMRGHWPFLSGGLFSWAQARSDGSLWVWWSEGGSRPTGARFAVLGPDGTPQPGWPVAAPGFTSLFADSRGRAYVIAGEGDVDVLEDIDPVAQP